MAMSKAIPGSVFPGELVRHSVTTKNFPDLKGDKVKHKKINPVVRFPGVSDPHSEKDPMLQKLKAMLSKKEGKLRPGYEMKVDEGYERMKEDLSWRGQGHLANRAHV